MAMRRIFLRTLIFASVSLKDAQGLSGNVCPEPATETRLNPKWRIKVVLSQETPVLDRRHMLQTWGAAAGLVASIVLPGNAASALSPEEASAAYDSYAYTYDDLDGGPASSALGIDEARADLFRKARGRVLEIGVGTGLNLAKYDLSKVTSLTLVDISEGMIQAAKDRLATMEVGIPIDFIRADATSQLVDRFGEGSFDSAVDSFSLCVMGNEGAKNCIIQLSKVLKPTGHLYLLENTRSSNAALGWYQDLTASTTAFVGGKGCVYNQNLEEIILQTKGLNIENEQLYAAGLFRSYVCSKRVM
jgi:methyltransferase OMS1, mitochondrial